jgi:hypothetical protein
MTRMDVLKIAILKRHGFRCDIGMWMIGTNGGRISEEEICNSGALKFWALVWGCS